LVEARDEVEVEADDEDEDEDEEERSAGMTEGMWRA
jgi:hypothetical protein